MEIRQADVNDYRTIYNDITPRHPELRGRVAVITGSSRGIGKGIAVRLAREGMKVVINSRTPDDVERTTGELRELGADALSVPADLSDTAGVDALFQQALRTYGTVHLLVNNAAIKRREHFFEVSEELLDQHLAANIRGPYLCAQRAAAIMRDGEGGSIVHISSIGGITRIVHGECSGEGHAWCEVLVGTEKDWDEGVEIVRSFFGYRDRNVQGDRDGKARWWLSLDWILGVYTCNDGTSVVAYSQ